MMESGRAILDVSRATLPLSDWGRVADFTVLEGALSIFFEIWWTRWDSNPRPPHCERGITKAKTRRHNQLAFERAVNCPTRPTASSLPLWVAESFGSLCLFGLIRERAFGWWNRTSTGLVGRGSRVRSSPPLTVATNEKELLEARSDARNCNKL